MSTPTPTATATRRWPDIETVLQDLLAPFVGGADHVGSETPDDLQDWLPFVRVNRIGGGDDGIHTDTAAVDVDVFGTRRTPTWALAEEIREFLLATPLVLATEAGDVVVDRVTTDVAPFQPPGNPDENVRRFTSSYTASFRRARTSTR
jgi:hypothetical protein